MRTLDRAIFRMSRIESETFSFFLGTPFEKRLHCRYLAVTDYSLMSRPGSWWLSARMFRSTCRRFSSGLMSGNSVLLSRALFSILMSVAVRNVLSTLLG